MNPELTGKVALVTGSSRGMGRATALGFAREGASVSICARNADKLRATADEIRHTTGTAVLATPADVAIPAEIDRFVDATLAAFGRIDALVCNAGGPPPLRFAQATEDDWERAMTLSLHSTRRLVTRVLPVMQSQRRGSVVAITSTTVIEPSPQLPLSTVPRLGVAGLFKLLARECALDGIRFNVVCPGGFRTDRSLDLLRRQAAETDRPVEELLAESGREIPLGRLGEPEEIADVIVFLCSPKAGYVTGALLPVDGGITLAL
jgi:3-oxoacyl-[acyl-carrier protein] reductase